MASQSSTPRPIPDTFAQMGHQSNNTIQSLETMLKNSQYMTAKCLSKLISNNPIICINKTMEQLELCFSLISTNSLHPACQALEYPAHSAHCTSVKVVDSNSKLILVYLGRHLQYESHKNQPVISSVSKPIYFYLKATNIIN